MNSIVPTLRKLAFLSAIALSAQPAWSATEHWIAVPGTSVTTNWSDSANWSSPASSYFNQVQFTSIGSSAPYVVNTVLDKTTSSTGPSGMPIWQLDFIATNANYTTLIQPGVTLLTGAGNGKVNIGAGATGSSVAPANAVETVVFTGANGSFVVTPASGNSFNVSQGSGSADTHNIICDMSGLGTFQMVYNTSTRFLVGTAGGARNQGTVYLAMTNNIQVGNDLNIGYEGGNSNSMPCAVYLGITNYILTGSQVVVSHNGCTNGILKFNPAFVGGATPPVAYFGSTASGGRGNWYIAYANGASVPGYGIADFSGGNVTVMAATMNIGVGGNNSAKNSALAVLTLDNGLVNANSVILGNQTTSAGGAAAGIINLNRNSVYNTNATLLVNNTLTLGSLTGTLTSGTAGTVNINGGQLTAGSIVSGGGAANIYINGGGMTVGGTAGSATSPLTSLTATNAAISLGLALNTTNVTVSNLTTAGANTISIISAPPLSTVPTVFTLIKYSGSIGGSGYNFTLGTLPALCSGYLSNDVANSSVDLVLTSGPLGLTWDGDVNGNWDTTTTNWIAAGPVAYADGDYVTFNDSGATGNIALQSTFTPGKVTVTNNTLAYTFTGGSIAGGASLVKQGTGTLIIDNSGNTYVGGVNISGGTVQVGNGDTSGDLPGSIANNGTLVYDRTDNITISNAISGTGAVVSEGGDTILMAGANSFTNNIMVTNNGTLKLGSTAATGNGGTGSGGVVIANGSTLDVNGYSMAKQIFVSGNGSSGLGAITDSGGSVSDSSGGISKTVTLLGDTSFYFPTRWDLGQTGSGSVLNTSGNAYNLTLNAASPSTYYEFRNLSMDSGLGNITVASGIWGVVGSTTFGQPGYTLTIENGAFLRMYNAPPNNVNVNKNIDFQAGGEIDNFGGNNAISGSITLEPGYDTFNIGNGTTLTLSNSITGSGTLYQNGGTGSLVIDAGSSSPSFSGGVYLYTGSLVLNGSIGSGITAPGFNSSLLGSGTATGVVDVSGNLFPGTSGGAGTLTVGGLTLESGSTLTMDVAATNTVGSGVNDLIVVNGDLNANGNTLYINPTGASLNGTYTLLTYTGNANSFFSGASTLGASRYVFTLTNNTSVSPAQVNLIVSGSGGGPASLVWNNAAGNGNWDTQGSQNWSNQVTHASADYFFTQDSVTFDDSITNSANPTTSISIPGTVIPNMLTNNSSANYTFTGSGKISGGASIVKLGTGTLTIATTNDFTGTITVGNGTLVQGTNYAFGTGSTNLLITNSGTVDLHGYSLNARPIIVSGAGVGGNGAIINNGQDPVYDNPGGLTSVTLAGDATFGAGTSRWDLGSPSGGTLSTSGQPYNLSLVGNSNAPYWEWDNVTIDPALANINITSGTLGVKAMTSLGDPNGTVTINAGGNLTFWGGSGYAKNYDVKSGGLLLVRQSGPNFNLNLTLEDGSTLESVDVAKTITGSVNLTGMAQITVQNGALTLSGAINGTGGFYMDNSDSNPLILNNVNNYTGPTLLTNSGSGCTLKLTGNGSIYPSSTIGLASGTTLDVSGLPTSTLMLGGNQTLTGAGTLKGSLSAPSGSTVTPGINGKGTLTVTNAVTLAGTTSMNVGTNFNNLLNATNITYGGTLSLSFTPGSLAAGNSFKLFNAGTYSNSFDTITPSPGSGLAWDASQLNVNGTLRVVSSVPPSFSKISVNGSTLSMSGTGGTANGSYHIYTTTNLAAPNWVVYGSGSFDANGNFNFQTSVNPSDVQRFFILSEP